MELFSSIHKGGATIVMITHEQSIADHAEKIYYIRDGELSEAPPVAEKARKTSEETRSNAAAPRRQGDYVSEGERPDKS